MSESDVRDANGRFVKGHPGGPGRPRNPVVNAIAEFDRRGIEVAQRLIDVIEKQGLEGNLRAAEMVLQRVWPVRRNRPIEVVNTDPDEDVGPYTIVAHGAVASSMLDGEITPNEAHAAARVLKLLQEQMEAAEKASAAISYTAAKP
ncbi:MAG: hypothetical protein J0J01_16470 [Reyranella sp.]|uniref:hypothetical protein n=1 Tax=Reyranella sp. TaxID=1929291 RepID=UPI001AD54714|nr:hypothetical protein [Reyranella sp.]MBN9088499.1 hypothetical protein [Reyranella sp.]